MGEKRRRKERKEGKEGGKGRREKPGEDIRGGETGAAAVPAQNGTCTFSLRFLLRFLLLFSLFFVYFCRNIECIV